MENTSTVKEILSDQENWQEDRHIWKLAAEALTGRDNGYSSPDEPAYAPEKVFWACDEEPGVPQAILDQWATDNPYGVPSETTKIYEQSLWAKKANPDSFSPNGWLETQTLYYHPFGFVAWTESNPLSGGSPTTFFWVA